MPRLPDLCPPTDNFSMTSFPCMCFRSRLSRSIWFLFSIFQMSIVSTPSTAPLLLSR
ncbi:hypothetical protein ARMSODRAFT_673765 [Armillaria solidipes]|uniref:Uncharacterized protein n=1 Tax=Armillaria solidipes TaxID=1076256 RepID=A0A2H3BB78_9AGAR|nr:hypothetical protein ARMSODRAFT_673765 [Armillaria solidipes]